MNKNIYWVLCLTLLCSCSYFYKGKKNVKSDGFLYIYPEMSYAQVLDSIRPFLRDLDEFDNYAQSRDYDKKVKIGKYKVSTDDTNESLVLRLLNGKEEQVKIRVKNSPTIFHLARDMSRYVIGDSTEMVAAILQHPRVVADSLDMETAKMYFLPNTYFFRWYTRPKDFVDRMMVEHDKFWNEERKKRLQKTGMTELEVYTLASIVQKEAAKADEQPRVAQAYLNRLKRGIKLEADPTSVYAYQLVHGFTTKVQRVYHKHTHLPSEYNTYKISGLPPAPICLPNTTAIDAVLKPEPHDFIFFCADPDRPGYHSFASTYTEHERNAAKYRKWLNENNIK